MKPIAYLVSQYPAYSHTCILREVDGLRARGWSIAVAAINPSDRPVHQHTFYVKPQGVLGAGRALWHSARQRPRALWQGLRLAVRLGGWNIPALLYQIAYWAEALILGQWLQRQHIGHLHVHFATPAASVGLLVKRMFPISLSLTAHGPDEFCETTCAALREKIASAEFVLCPSLYVRSQLMARSSPLQWSKLLLSPLGVDPQQFQPRPIPAAEPFTVLCVGRFVAANGQMVLLQAIARLHGQGRAVRLVLVGHGPDHGLLQAAIYASGLHAVVELVGALDQSRIQEYYRQAQVLCLASFADGIPVVLMEAMAMEIPCVSTWVADVPELIRHQQDGLLVMPSDELGLAQALAQLMDDPALAQRLGRQGRQRVVERYNLPHNLDQLSTVLQQRLEGHSCACGHTHA